LKRSFYEPAPCQNGVEGELSGDWGWIGAGQFHAEIFPAGQSHCGR